jgi:hypothetical protein
VLSALPPEMRSRCSKKNLVFNFQTLARSPSHGKCSKRFCGSLRNCGRSHHQRQHETLDGQAFNSIRREECAKLPGKTARSGCPTALSRVDWWQQSTPRVGLAGRTEKRENCDRSGIIRGIPAKTSSALISRENRRTSDSLGACCTNFNRHRDYPA